MNNQSQSDIIYLPTIAHQIISLRKAILRPDQYDTSWCDYKGDREDNSIHFKALCKGKTIGIVTIISDIKNINQRNFIWRIRGLGVLPKYRNLQIGTSLILHGIQELRNTEEIKDGIWLSGRTNQTTFYQFLGFKKVGNTYNIMGTGEHSDFIYDKT